MKKLKQISFLALLCIVAFNGCKKELADPPASLLVTSNSSSTESMVFTPAGKIPKSHAHFIEPGNHLHVANGHVLKVHDKTENIVEDLGVIKAPIQKSSLLQQSAITQHSSRFITRRTVDNTDVPNYDNWEAYSEWLNNSGYPIDYFSTTWVVPPDPDNTTDNQLIFIFNGLESGSSAEDILQPVLQWGSSHAGGGTYWAIGNWYLWTDGVDNYVAYSSLTAVTPGTSLTGVITGAGQDSYGSYDYTSSFLSNGSSIGYPLDVTYGNVAFGYMDDVHVKGGVTIPFINEQLWAYEALEVYNHSGVNGGYGVLRPSDYPNIAYVPMTNITLTTNSTPVSMTWNPVIGAPASVGEHASIISSNASGSGEVDLYLAPMRPTFTISRGSSAGNYTVSITPNIASAVTSVVYYTDLSTSVTNSTANSPTSVGIGLTVGHTYSIYVITTATGNVSNGPSVSQNFYAYF